jgi:hypothetical protein
MNYYEYFKRSKGNRDPVFKYALDLFNEKPIHILEIGAARNISFEARQGDGWSTLHFLDYIAQFGGSLKIVDIDNVAIENCKNLISSHPKCKNANFTLECGQGINFISEGYDLIYLDGGDSTEEMADELSKINLDRSIVLCDDFHTKGAKARTIFKNFISIKWEGHIHEMAIYHKNTNDKLLLNPIQTN